MNKNFGEGLNRYHHINRRESEPAHFFVNGSAAEPAFQNTTAAAAVTNRGASSFIVLFRYSSSAKLMPKIHTLTDN